MIFYHSLRRRDLAITLIMVIIASLGFYNASAQDAWQNVDMQNALNPYSQSTIHIAEGRNKLDVYGSGDVNNDETINWEDAQAIRNGVSNHRADVNCDGIEGNEADAKIIDDYVNGNIQHMPGDWNHLDATEKINWLEKWIEVEPWNMDPNGTLRYCGNFVNQQVINSTGVTNPQNWNSILDGKYSAEDNALAGIPIYYVSTTIRNEFGNELPHAVCGVLVGDEDAGRYDEDVKNINHWYFWDPMRLAEDNGRIYPGGLHLRNQARINQNIETMGYEQFNLVNFEFPNNDGNIVSELQYGIEERMNPTNPNKPETEPPQINASNTEVPFVYAKADSTHVNENPASASDNEDPNPSLAYDWSSNQTSTGILTDVNYDINVNVTAIDRTGNSAEKDYSIFVRDKVAPTGNFSASQVYGDEGENPTEIAKGLVKNVEDNSRLPVDTTFTSTLTTDNVYESIYSVNAELKDIAGNKKNIGNLEVILTKADTEAPIISTEDKTIPYVEGKSIEVYVNENQASVTDNMDMNPIVNYNWTNDKEGTDDREYNIFVNVDATDNAGNSSEADYKLVIEDTTTSVGIEQYNKSFDLETPYPNPVSGTATIPYNSNSTGPVNFQLYNTSGKLVENFSQENSYGKNSFNHDFSSHADGVYFLRMTDSEGNYDITLITIK